jgi:uncharacterized protein YndB with AHSA1/START domain
MPSDLRPVGTEFFEAAPYRFLYSAVIRRPPTAVFEAVGRDPAGWGEWYPGFDHTGRWLEGAEPGIGARRRVRMARVTYDETILAWDPPHRFAFRVDRSNAPFAYALAEDYVIGDHPAGSTLQWRFAIDPRPVLRPARGLFDPVLDRLFHRAATNLEKYLQA